MRPLIRLAPLLMACALTACAGIDVSTNYDPSAVQQLDGYKTYAWLPQPQGSDKRVYNPIVGGEVERAADAYLQSHGYQKVEANPDFLLGWHGAIDNKLEADTVNAYYGYPYDPMWDPFYGGGPVAMSAPETVVREYEQGTLIIDVVDAQSKKLVWRGQAQSEIDDSAKAEKQQSRINQSVEEILERFPPRGGK
ncbi:DUF4136 domain-containing protein [Myxococcus sp. AB025B]|uniref:DUF4136 domain-containing protein n=1 Tax=Myxococcus TaxID=32 RepID=UPI001143DFB1|nr:DUF4136 domain-containing protein [Myxococcus sp. AB025B]